MGDGRQRENGRHRPDQYQTVHAQWISPQHQQMKDPMSIKIMAALADRDTAIQERNLAISEKKVALAERDMAILQRDAAITERNNAMMDRDSAIASLQYARENAMNGSGPTCPPGCGMPHGNKHMHHPAHVTDAAPYHKITEASPISVVSDPATKPTRKVKKVASRPPKKVKCGGKDLNKQEGTLTKHEWKGQDLGLNQVAFDDSSMPVPVCSCTGFLQQCYKWGNGGWQSACCTTTMSMYPLPVMPNKRHARIGGRKMSGTVFNRLLSRLAAEGYDLSAPLDLKDHWSKHGTNRYITIK
eukprot:TRINITY_DN3943_c1_g2_i1.p1 TRINITY_DN3943_c1_g2~~TRINITY_DN3943_c1_g2_i1.p1  ORF type:complete len:300 (+),score=40.81 TRINITY_DN3943_c1_g2_i1:344-1243(+)